MDRERSLELLNATHEFPCAFTIKVIGTLTDDFVHRILSAVRDDEDVDDDFPYSTRSTPGGRHVAVTMEPTLRSAEQVLAIYQRVRVVQGVVMTM